MFNTLDVILAMGLAWTMTGTALLFLKKRDTESGKLGILLILVMGLSLFDNFSQLQKASPDTTLYFYALTRNSYFLIGPFLWFYVQSLTGVENLFVRRNLFHLLPFIVGILFSLTHSQSVIPVIGELGQQTDFSIFTMKLKESLSFISRIIYVLTVLYLIRKHSKRVPDFYSHKSIRNTLSWLFYLILFYLILFSLSFILLFLPPEVGGVIKMRLTETGRIAPPLLFVLCFTILAGDQTEQKDLISNEFSRDKEAISKDKYTKSGISEKESKKIYITLMNYLQSSKKYTDPEMTLDSLAEELDISRHKLSQSINRESGERFYTIINSLRLDEFMFAIDENRFPDYTIIAIAFECGFKSSSAFYTLFKKKHGKTPKEFIKNS